MTYGSGHLHVRNTGVFGTNPVKFRYIALMLLSVLANTDKTHHVAGLSVLYTNRAISRHKTGDCQGCVQDCTIALQLTPHSTKPLLRRAVAYEVMERYAKLLPYLYWYG